LYDSSTLPTVSDEIADANLGHERERHAPGGRDLGERQRFTRTFCWWRRSWSANADGITLMLVRDSRRHQFPMLRRQRLKAAFA
jgi:hypothetical protein